MNMTFMSSNFPPLDLNLISAISLQCFGIDFILKIETYSFQQTSWIFKILNFNPTRIKEKLKKED